MIERATTWRPGSRVAHRFNPELGPGMITDVDARRVSVFFPESGETLTIAAGSDALEPLRLEPGMRAKIESTGEAVTVVAIEGDEATLADGRTVDAGTLWPLPRPESPVDQLAAGEIDAFEDFQNRLDGVRLERVRRADGLGSFLGGRIELFPHQLYAAERASDSLASGPVRWLLADEVGLGKTVEACLILNRLMHRGAAERVLIVAPETLIVQWLGELWRKYHRVFVLIDDARLADVRREHGKRFNPFDVYRHAIVSTERLASSRWLARRAKQSKPDLVVVDEAHHLRRPGGRADGRSAGGKARSKGRGRKGRGRGGHRGNDAYRALAPILRASRHALLLTATPLDADAHNFFRLLQLLRPGLFPRRRDFGAQLKKRLQRRKPLPPCTSATRRADIGGLPEREPIFVDLEQAAWQPIDEVVNRLRKRARGGGAGQGGQSQRGRSRGRSAHRRATRAVRAALASPAATLEVLRERKGVDQHLVRLAEKALDADPRLAWLVEHARGWRERREKTLVFVPDRTSLEWLAEALRKRARVEVGVFHEDLSPQRRDLEVARFRADDGPAILVSTEAGGEGRNFQFCRRLVLFDLPWSPAVTEQRIGRLDRIGRDRPTEIVVFRPPRGLARALVDLYDRLGMFREPLGGLIAEAGGLAREIERVALRGPRKVEVRHFEQALERAKAAIDRVERRALHELHRAPYEASMAKGILDRVPDGLDALTERTVIRACERFGFTLDEGRGPRAWHVELGTEALVEQLPGVPPGSSFVGTFDRALAVDDESLDFFASGHPLVEGVLAELEDGSRGRVGLFQVSRDELPEAVEISASADDAGLFVLAIFAGSGDGSRTERERGPDAERPPRVVVVDSEGRRRDALAAAILERRVALRRVDAKAWTSADDWADTVRRVGAGLVESADGEDPVPPLAVAAFRIAP